MSILYLLALVAVAVALLTVTFSAIAAVTRRPEWERHPARPTLQVIATVERRKEDLPFVGRDRRDGTGAEEIPAPEVEAA